MKIRDFAAAAGNIILSLAKNDVIFTKQIDQFGLFAVLEGSRVGILYYMATLPIWSFCRRAPYLGSIDLPIKS